MKIVYTIAGTYRPAGMERILTDKANYLATKGYNITIVTTEQKGRPDAFPLNQAIRREDLAIGYEDNNGRSFLSKVLSHPFKKFNHRKKLGKLLEQIRPNVTISMFCGDESFLPNLKFAGKTILEVHFSRFKRIQYGRKGFWALADKYRSRQDIRIIHRFNHFVALTQEDLGYWGNPANGTVIPNFISRFPTTPSSLESKTVLAVGRYDYQKGFERLISAWKKVCSNLPEGHGWMLKIVGDGPLKDSLKRQIAEDGLQGFAVVGESASDMDAVYRNASVYALSSRYEGLPMVLLEAQSYGLPIVAFDCKCGPKDVVTDGKDGLLIKEGDVEGLSGALLKLINNGELLKTMGHNALEASKRWNRESAMERWISLIDGC